MIEINVYKPIDKEDVFFKYFGEEDPFAFSADTIHEIFDRNPNEKEFKFNINCDGGLVSEGLRIYDVLRTSGKTFHCNVEGGCHSMAIVLLLAAPKENRSANPNARALIHEVRGGSWESLTSEELRTLADEVDSEQNAILDIYTERTGKDRTELENLMKEEKVRTAQELLNYGFISKINTYSTNKNKGTMSKQKKQAILNAADKFLKGLKNLLKPEDVVNYDFTDEDGNILFSTEKEDDSLEVGDAASPDGTFTLPDGRTVTIADGVVTEITESPEEDEEVENLQNRISELENALTEAQTIITNLRNELGSSYQAKPRNNQPKGGKQAPSVEDIKNDLREKRNQMKGGKK
ncbi:MAG: hypothetical protein BGO29_14800 [Bacteroidales bacterium 36-12]|nr:MAG: hypothetical protein BGO29_14800 [Bacteroidales bacterium 36-12]